MYTVQLYPADRCNLRCKYCYNYSRSNELMTKEVLYKVISDLSEKVSLENLSLMWHGGEPLLAGLDFFRYAVELQNQFFGGLPSNILQTNALLLSDESIEFFVQNDFTVQTSLDGLVSHNSLRVYPNGGESHSKVLQRILAAKSKGLDIGAHVSISSVNAGAGKDIYRFFKEHDIGFDLGPIVECEGNEDNAGLGVSPSEYACFAIDVFEAWFYDKEYRHNVNPLMNIVLSRLLPQAQMDSIVPESCLEEYICVVSTGEVYPCGKFAGRREFLLGNVQNDSLSDILISERRANFANRPVQIIGCESCQIGGICHGGCPFQAWLSNDTILGKDSFCEAYRQIFSHVYEAVDQQVEILAPDFVVRDPRHVLSEHIC